MGGGPGHAHGGGSGRFWGTLGLFRGCGGSGGTFEPLMEQPALRGAAQTLIPRRHRALSPPTGHRTPRDPAGGWGAPGAAGAGGPRDGRGGRRPEPPGAARTCARGETRQTRAEVQEKVYWRRSEASATRDPLPEWGGCPDPPWPRPSPSPPPVAAPALRDGGFGAGTSQTGHPPTKKMLNSWGLAALWDGGTSSPSFPPPQSRGWGRGREGPCQNHPHSRYPGWGELRFLPPKTNQKKQPKKKKERNHEEVPKGLEQGQVGPVPGSAGDVQFLGSSPASPPSSPAHSAVHSVRLSLSSCMMRVLSL